MTTPDPDLKRPYQLLYSAGVQQELLPGLSASLNYYYRKYYNDFWVDNLATTHADYSIIPIADPRGNGETIHDLQHRAGQAGRDRQPPVQLHRERPDSTTASISSMNSRFRNGTQLQGGVNTGKPHDPPARWTIRTCSGSATGRIRSDAVQNERHGAPSVWVPGERRVLEPARPAQRSRRRTSTGRTSPSCTRCRGRSRRA